MDVLPSMTGHFLKYGFEIHGKASFIYPTFLIFISNYFLLHLLKIEGLKNCDHFSDLN